jgi:hypothetical protein
VWGGALARRETHEQDCVRLLGQPYAEVHEWLDHYAKEYNPHVYLEYHRKFRHTEEALDEKFEEWGHYRQMAAKIHIVRDCELYVLSKPFDQVEIEEIDELFEKSKQYLHW